MTRLFSLFFVFGVMQLRSSYGGENTKTWSVCRKDNSTRLLDCSNLGLKYIPIDVFSTTFENIKLGGNPYICDCNMSTFARAMQLINKHAERIVDPMEMKCENPPKSSGRPMLQFPVKNGFCSPTKMKRAAQDKVDKEPSWKDCKVSRMNFYLDCSALGFTKPPKGVFDQGMKYAFILLAENPYVCDCSMAWFIDRLTRDNFQALVEDRHHITCAGPKELAGVKTDKIIRDRISLCAKPTTTKKPDASPTSTEENRFVMAYIPAFAAIVSLVVSVGVVVFLWRRKKAKERAWSHVTEEFEREQKLMEKNNLGEQVFLFNGCFDDTPGVQPNVSTITEWSEDENVDYDN